MELNYSQYKLIEVVSIYSNGRFKHPGSIFVAGNFLNRVRSSSVEDFSLIRIPFYLDFENYLRDRDGRVE